MSKQHDFPHLFGNNNGKSCPIWKDPQGEWTAAIAKEEIAIAVDHHVGVIANVKAVERNASRAVIIRGMVVEEIGATGAAGVGGASVMREGD